MAGLKAFGPGVWNGEVIGPADVVALATNYAALAAGTPPYYLPYVSINHDDSLSFGRVTAARIDPADGRLVLDLDGVPETVREWMRTDRLTSPSVEYWTPGTFTMPDGTFNTSPVLRCVTLLGNEAPGVKGLPPLAAAQFRDGRRCVLAFADLPPATRPGATPMDERNTILKTMADMGLDTKSFTDAIPTESLKSMLDFAQKCMADRKKYEDDAKAKGDDGETKKEMADDTKKDEPDGDEVKKYRDLPAVLRKQLDDAMATIKAASAVAAKTVADAKAAKVKAFRDEMTGVGRPHAFMTPAQFDAVEPLLLQLDGATVRKFADGKTDGTALDEQFAKLRAAYATPVKKFGDAMKNPLADTGAGATLAPAINYAVAPKATDLSPAALAVLNSTPEGQAALRQLK